MLQLFLSCERKMIFYCTHVWPERLLGSPRGFRQDYLRALCAVFVIGICKTLGPNLRVSLGFRLSFGFFILFGTFSPFTSKSSFILVNYIICFDNLKLLHVTIVIEFLFNSTVLLVG